MLNSRYLYYIYIRELCIGETEQYSGRQAIKKRIASALEIVFWVLSLFFLLLLFFFLSSLLHLDRDKPVGRNRSIGRLYFERYNIYVCVTGHRWCRKNRKLSNWRVRGPSAPPSRQPACKARVGGRISREEKVSSFILSSFRLV